MKSVKTIIKGQEILWALGLAGIANTILLSVLYFLGSSKDVMAILAFFVLALSLSLAKK